MARAFSSTTLCQRGAPLGYRSRAAFKLMQLDDRFRLLRRAGASSIWEARRAAGHRSRSSGFGRRRAAAPSSASNILAMGPGSRAPTIIALDFLDPAAPGGLKAALGPCRSRAEDMAAADHGAWARQDHIRILALAEAAFDFAREVLAPAGAFLCKVFPGRTEGAFLAALKRDFTSARHAKPPASRSESAELYVVATGFRGQSA